MYPLETLFFPPNSMSFRFDFSTCSVMGYSILSIYHKSSVLLLNIWFISSFFLSHIILLWIFLSISFETHVQELLYIVGAELFIHRICESEPLIEHGKCFLVSVCTSFHSHQVQFTLAQTVYSVWAVSYTHLTLPTSNTLCRSRWSPYH